MNWEIELESGECLTYSEVAEIREELIAGKVQLSDNCRLYKDVLIQVDGSQKQYDKVDETEWKTVKDFADREFLLLSLYDPRKAYGKKVAENTAIFVGIVVAIGWVADGLIAFGANPLMGIVLSIILLITVPTIVIGAFTGMFVANAYNIPVIGLFLRILLAYLIGALVGAAIDYTNGRWIGFQIGSRKPKLIAA